MFLKRFICFVGATLFSVVPFLSLAQEVAKEPSLADTIDTKFGEVTGPFVGFIFSSFKVGDADFLYIAGWLLVAAIITTIYFAGVQFTHSKLAIDIVRGKYTDPNKKTPGEVSHFQALTTALSGTVGLGNIAGVGAAVAIGGPGATFWMILVGLFGMALKFTECTLGVKYRHTLPSGKTSGGPMYYLEKGFAEKGAGMKVFGKILAIAFAIFTVISSFGAGNMFQSNQAAAALTGAFMDGATNDSIKTVSMIIGAVMAVLVFIVVIGGIQSIAKVTDKMVPAMAGMYLLMAVIVVAMNFSHIGEAFSSIFNGAFTGAGVAGGFIGAMIQGLKRATFSNEAGAGSAAIAHSAVKTDEPVTEGLVSLLEPFIDTVIICTMTALVITFSGLNTAPFDGKGLTGVDLTAAAFSKDISWFRPALTIAIVLFAFSTMISWCYYGTKATTYLFGEGKTVELVYKLLFCFFVFVGTALKFGAILDFSDAAFFTMAIFNVIGLYVLMPVVKREFKSFIARVKSGEIKRFD